MKIGEYLEIGKKMKQARTAAGISQKEMAERLLLQHSAYSNYENEYSVPNMDVILKFCEELNMTFNDLLGIHVETGDRPVVKTFADLFSILIDLDKRGLKVVSKTTYEERDNQLIAHLNMEIPNAQLAIFIPNWNKMNDQLANGEISEEEYEDWKNYTLRLFNIPIDDYL